MIELVKEGIREHLEAKKAGISIEEYRRTIEFRRKHIDFVAGHSTLPQILAAAEELSGNYPDVVITIPKAESIEDSLRLRLSWRSTEEEGQTTWNEVGFEPRVEYDLNPYYLLVHSGEKPYLMDPDNFQSAGRHLPEPFLKAAGQAIVAAVINPEVKKVPSTPDPFGLNTRTVLFGGSASSQEVAA